MPPSRCDSRQTAAIATFRGQESRPNSRDDDAFFLAIAARPGGLLAFDTRDPADKAWERWAADGGGYTGAERVVLADGLVRDTTTTFVAYEDGVAMFETYAVPFDGTAAHDSAAAPSVPAR